MIRSAGVMSLRNARACDRMREETRHFGLDGICSVT